MLRRAWEMWHRKTTFHRAKNIAKNIQGLFYCVDQRFSDREKGIGKESERVGVEGIWREKERSGKISQSPLCWFCKSATSAAYFLPKHCSVEWSPQTGPFLIFVAMHYQVHWCMCALIAHSNAWCMRCLWEGGLQPHRASRVTAWCSGQRDASFTTHGWCCSSEGREQSGSKHLPSLSLHAF